MKARLLTRSVPTVLLARELRVDAVPVDIADDASIPVTIATTAPVPRYGVLEVLDCSPAGVDLSREPLSLIVGHDNAKLAIGVVENLRADGGKVTGMARFSSSPEAQQVRADVIAGIHPYVSVGYRLLDEGTPVEGGYMFRWQPHEVSIVSIPADPAAGFFRSLTGVSKMPAPDATIATRAEIVTLCRTRGVSELAEGMIARNLTVDAARAEVVEELARRDAATGTFLNVRGRAPGAAQERSLIVNTLVARMGGKVDGEIIRATDCMGLAVRALNLSGQRVGDGDGRNEIFRRALHTTSDFPALLGEAVGRVLLQAYEQSPAAIKPIARLANLPDFRQKTTVRLGPAASLEKVNEHGEFTYGTVQESSDGWRLTTWGRIIGVSRQALINDDLGGFSQLLAKFGQSAAQREAAELVTILTNPPNVSGAALFSAGRKSLITGAGSALQLSSLADAVKSLRGQADLDGSLVNQEPATLLVPAALELTALQLVAQYIPATASNVQPYKLSVAVEARLDAISTTAWYLVAGNQSSLEYGYLEGAQGVQTEQREGFEVDGLEIKARLDFGCGWVAPLGWVKSNGA